MAGGVAPGYFYAENEGEGEHVAKAKGGHVAKEAKRLHRSDDRVLAGVCAGIAEYWDTDPLLIRILTVLLTISTFGGVALIYILLWLVMPQQVNMSDTISCDAHLQAHSKSGVGKLKTRHGFKEPHPSPNTNPNINININPNNDINDNAQSAASGAPRATAQAAAPSASQVSQTAVKSTAQTAQSASQQNQHTSNASAYAYAQDGYAAEANFAAQAASPATPSSTHAEHYEAAAHTHRSDETSHDADNKVGGSTRLIVGIGLLLLFVGIAVLFSAVVEEISWWQLWPCLIVLTGLVTMVIPPPHNTSFLHRFSYGIVIIELGLALLMMTLHVLSWRTVPAIFSHLWPLLIIILGAILIAHATKSRFLGLAITLCVVAMIAFGVAVYGVPGTLEQMTVHMPFMGVRVFDVNPWI